MALEVSGQPFIPVARFICEPLILWGFERMAKQLDQLRIELYSSNTDHRVDAVRQLGEQRVWGRWKSWYICWKQMSMDFRWPRH